MTAPLDNLDRKLLRLLQQDGRISNVELAERVGLSPTATSERVKRLTREGIIAGYGARLDPVKLGRGFLVFVEVTLDKTTPDVFDRFGAAVARAPDVLECHLVAGGGVGDGHLSLAPALLFDPTRPGRRSARRWRESLPHLLAGLFAAGARRSFCAGHFYLPRPVE